MDAASPLPSACLYPLVCARGIRKRKALNKKAPKHWKGICGEDEAHLVTGNLKHFPAKPFIVTAREFLDILNGNK